MISGTQFLIVEFDEIADVLDAADRRLWSDSDIRQIAAQSAAGEALCLRGPSGVVVLELRPEGDHLELWVRVAVGQSIGAFRQAEPDLVSIARDLGARTVAFASMRRGWQRLLGKHWSIRGEDYVRPVDEQA